MNLSYVAMTLLNVTIGVVAYISFEVETAQVISNNLLVGSSRVAVNVMVAVLSSLPKHCQCSPECIIFEITENCFSRRLYFYYQEALVKKKKSIHKSIFTPSVITFRLLMVSINVIFAAAFPSKSYILALVGSIAGISLKFIFLLLFHMKMYTFRRWHGVTLWLIVLW